MGVSLRVGLLQGALRSRASHLTPSASLTQKKTSLQILRMNQFVLFFNHKVRKVFTQRSQRKKSKIIIQSHRENPLPAMQKSLLNFIYKPYLLIISFISIALFFHSPGINGQSKIVHFPH